jgi:predicted amidohydrolase YtcJ
VYKDVGLRDNAIRAYQNLRMRGELKCRTQMMYTWLWSIEDAQRAAERFTPYGDDWLMLRSIKMSLDGGIKSRTAWTHDHWYRNFTEPANDSGYWKIPPEQFEQMVEIVHAAGLQICCHCEGDKAIDTYLDAIERALERHPRTNCRHTIIHCNLPTDHAVERMRKLGDNIAIETQAPWLGDCNWAASCGPERSKRFIPLKTWLRNDIIVGNSCDFPPEPFPPRFGLSSACTREPERGTYGKYPFGTDECLTFEEALYTYTLGAAKCLFWDDKIGSLEPGKYADFVVWEQDLATIPPQQIKNASVLMTVIEGKIVFCKEKDASVVIP